MGSVTPRYEDDKASLGGLASFGKCRVASLTESARRKIRTPTAFNKPICYRLGTGRGTGGKQIRRHKPRSAAGVLKLRAARAPTAAAHRTGPKGREDYKVF